MKRLILAALLASGAPTSAMAEAVCQYGKGGVFEFVSWSFKMTADRGMEVSITFHNKLDMDLSWYEMHVEVGDHMFGVRSDVPVKADGEATAIDHMGMPQKDADMFAPLTPLLCAIGVTDGKGEHVSYY